MTSSRSHLLLTILAGPGRYWCLVPAAILTIQQSDPKRRYHANEKARHNGQVHP